METIAKEDRTGIVTPLIIEFKIKVAEKQRMMKNIKMLHCDEYHGLVMA